MPILVSLFGLGLCIGSFLNVIISRVPKGLRIGFTRSKCPNCNTPLNWQDLVPVLSFIALKSRCRFCGERISWRYPCVELITGLTLPILYVHTQPNWILWTGVTWFCLGLIALFFIDLETQLLPNALTATLGFTGLGWAMYHQQVLENLNAAAIGFICLWMVNRISLLFYNREGIGGGDMKLAAVFGIWWGLEVVGLTLYLSFLIGGLIGMILLLTKRKHRLDTIPFGPVMILGWVITMVYRQEITALWAQLSLSNLGIWDWISSFF